MDCFRPITAPLRQAYQERKLKRLQRQGHQCMICLQSYPMTVLWCQQSVCRGSSLERVPDEEI